MNDATEVPIRPASSVVLARDTDSGISAGISAGIELFMLERTSAAVFAGGMHVFPGGRVDDADHDPEYQQFAVGPDLAQRAQAAAVGENALGFWIAAIRECFEEAGFLLAYDAEGRMLELADEVTVARFVAHRAALNDGTLTMLQMPARVEAWTFTESRPGCTFPAFAAKIASRQSRSTLLSTPARRARSKRAAAEPTPLCSVPRTRASNP